MVHLEHCSKFGGLLNHLEVQPVELIIGRWVEAAAYHGVCGKDKWLKCSQWDSSVVDGLRQQHTMVSVERISG